MTTRTAGGGITRNGVGWSVQQTPCGVDIVLAGVGTVVQLSEREAASMRTALAIAVARAEKAQR